MRSLLLLSAMLVLCWVIHADAQGVKRVALVIGNGAYSKASHLPNSLHDADDVAAALKRDGFEVIRGANLDKAGMQDAIVRFARASQNADVGLFYYSGHALQFNGVNYLMPVDAKLNDEADLYRLTKVDDVLGYLQQAKTLKVLVLDSCRDNPFTESLKRSAGPTRGATVSRGLARIEAPTGTIISYSTQAGHVAADGKGRNSPYTAAFLKYIERPAEIGDIFRDISADVYHATGETQLPELSLSMIGKYYFKEPPVPAAAIAPAQLAPTAPADACAAAGDHWKSAESIGTLPAFQEHLARFPACAFAALAKARIDALKSKLPAVAPPLPTPRPHHFQQTQQTAALTAATQPRTPSCDFTLLGVRLGCHSRQRR